MAVEPSPQPLPPGSESLVRISARAAESSVEELQEACRAICIALGLHPVRYFLLDAAEEDPA